MGELDEDDQWRLCVCIVSVVPGAQERERSRLEILT